MTDSNGKVIIYQHDAVGNRTQMTTPEGKVIQYSYDPANRLTQITPNGSGAFTFSYDGAGRRASLTFPNGVTTNYTYDTASRLTSIEHQGSSILNSFTYTFDKAGNRVTRTDPDKTYNYTYDDLYRLTQSLPTILNFSGNIDNVVTENFSYDPVGNRATLNVGDVPAVSGDWTYTYDYEYQLISAVRDSNGDIKTVTFKYDPFGRRIEKKSDEVINGEAVTKTYTYVYDNEDIILETYSEVQGANTITKTTGYVHGPGIDEPLSIDRDGTLYYYHADGLGSITALTNEAEAVVESYTYRPFGELKRYGNTVGNNYTYTGREWDEETGLYYYRARYYDPEVGKFISYDPILRGISHSGGSSCSRSINTLPLTTPQELNGYVYVGNNPVNFTDPQGLKKCVNASSATFVGFLALLHRLDLNFWNLLHFELPCPSKQKPANPRIENKGKRDVSIVRRNLRCDGKSTVSVSVGTREATMTPNFMIYFVNLQVCYDCVCCKK